MKKFSLILIFITNYAFSQVGIGTTNPEKILHVDTNKDNVVSPAPGVNQYKDDVAIDATGKMSIGNISPKTRLDIRTFDSTSNQTVGSIAIGTTNQTASDAKAGAMKYDPITPVPPSIIQGQISYSDGTTWSSLESKLPNDFVYASKTISLSIPNNADTNIDNWDTTNLKDANGSFDPSTGTFKAIQEGAYLVAFTYGLQSSAIANNSLIEASIIAPDSNNSTTNTTFRCINSFPGTNNASVVTGQCSGIFNLNGGERILIRLNNKLGSNKNTSTNPSLTTLTIMGL